MIMSLRLKTFLGLAAYELATALASLGGEADLAEAIVLLEESVLIMQVLDPTGHSIRLVVAPVIVLGINWRLPDIKDRSVEGDQLIVVVEVVEDVVNVLLSSRAGQDSSATAPLASVKSCPIAMFAISKVVVETIVGKPLVNWEPHIVEAADLHDHFPAIVEKGVEGSVAHHLVHLDHG